MRWSIIFLNVADPSRFNDAIQGKGLRYLDNGVSKRQLFKIVNHAGGWKGHFTGEARAHRQRKRPGNGRRIVEGASGAGGILSWKPCRAFLYFETTNVRVLCRRKHLWLPLNERKRRMWMCRLEERNGERVAARKLVLSTWFSTSLIARRGPIG